MLSTDEGEARSAVYMLHLRPSFSTASLVCVFDVSRWALIVSRWEGRAMHWLDNSPG